MLQALHIRIKGIVQGVGFRPYVYRLATIHQIHGTVLNSGEGVIIEAEGREVQLHDFLNALSSGPPELARIDSIEVMPSLVEGYHDFTILSSVNAAKQTAVSPDMAICEACLDEFNDPTNRRYHHALINCTECGPRYSITKTLPYDRQHTSMAEFVMCAACNEEYLDPANRRYHAQPTSCHECGPRISLFDSEAQLITHEHEAIKATAAMLHEGKIVAVKGIGGFHLMVDATNDAAVQSLRKHKQRPDKPLAVLFASLETLQQYADVSNDEANMLTAMQRPIVLVRKLFASALSPSIAPHIDHVGAMLAYTPLQHALFLACTMPLVATSANRSDEPIYRDRTSLLNGLPGVCDAVLDVDREIINAVDDSLLQMVRGKTIMMRMARGYAPFSMPIPWQSKQCIVAVGAQQKSSIAIAVGDHVMLSPHIGDLGTLEAFEYFERTLETFLRFYDVKPRLLVCDKHPDYATTLWAKAQKLPLLQVQHHYAHVLSCMLEHTVQEKVLAFTFDGTGYGDDGTIWGGEVLLADYHTCARVGHLKPFSLLGGDKAAKEPRRVALSLLFETFETTQLQTLALPTLAAFTQEEVVWLRRAWEQGVGTVMTSSVGRLFDAVASLCGVVQQISFEGESGLRLEALCHDEYAAPFTLRYHNAMLEFTPILDQILTMVHEGKIADVPDRFINTLVAWIAEEADRHLGYPIVLSGGVFQNRTLLARTLARLEQMQREVFVPERIPINDGGIALGQMAYALYHQKGAP
jgi:hydrogenase maturation protein HypF